MIIPKGKGEIKQDPFIIKLHKMHRPAVTENTVDLSEASPSCRATDGETSAADQCVACTVTPIPRSVLVSVRFFFKRVGRAPTKMKLKSSLCDVHILG